MTTMYSNFADSYRSLSELITNINTMVIENLDSNTKFKVNNHILAIEDDLARMGRWAREHGVFYAGSNICKTYEAPTHMYIRAACNNLKAFVIGSDKLPEGVQAVVDSLCGRLYKLSTYID